MCSHLSLVDLCENPQMDPQNPLPETPHYNMTPQNSADIWASYQGSFLPPGESSNGEGDRHPWPSMTWNGPVPALNSTRVPQSERKISHPLRKAGCGSSPSKQPRSSPHIPTARPSSKRQRISPRIRSDEEESVDECLSQSGSQTSCCSSCPDSPPCVEPDCTLAVPCTDRSCEVPVCTAPCLDIASQNQLAFSEHTRRFGNWQDSTWGPQTTEALLRKDPASDKLVDMTLEGACRAGYPVDSSPYSNIPSVVNNDAATPFSRSLSRPNTNYDSQSSYISGVLSGTGALFTHSNGLDGQSFEPVQDVNSSLSFNCPWDGCEQPSFISQDEWLPHLHEQHLDPQLTFRCPIPGDTCPTDIGFDFLGHLEDSHGYNFEDTFNCPAPNCDPSETYYDPSMLHNHFDHAHATPIEGTLHCRLDACNSGFTDPTQLFDHISHFHGLPIKLPSGEDIDLLVPPKTSQDTALLQRNDIPDADALSPVVPESKPDSPDQTTQHVCKWTSAVTPCGKICKSEADLQNHVTHDHLNLLDKGTGYNCQWQGCGRRDKRGLKSGFSQRGKLERHMATHTGCG